MQLRTAFLAADKDSGGALDLDEFIEAFGKVLGQGLNKKQLNQLFMRIDADSNGDVGKWGIECLGVDNEILFLLVRLE